MPAIKQVLGNVLGGGAATLAGIGILNYLREQNKSNILQKVMSQPKVKDPTEVTKYPIEVVDSFPNAFYIKGNLNARQRRTIQGLAEAAKSKGNVPLSQALQASERVGSNPSGGIVVGEPFLNKSIIKHEEGHAEDKSFLSAIAPKVEKAWKDYNLNVLGTVAALGGGLLYPKYSDHMMAANIVAQGLSTVPTLYSESKASEYAKQFPGVSKDLLDETYNSYVLRKLGDRLVVPSVAFLGSKIGESII